MDLARPRAAVSTDQEKVRSGPVSRVLYHPLCWMATAISLGSRLLDSSSGLPGSRWRVGPTRGTEPTKEIAGRIRCSLFDLAPGGVCLARLVAQPAGELLPHRFTLTARTKRSARRFAFCCTFPDLTAGGRYPSPCPAEPGLSSRRRRIWTDMAAPRGSAGGRPVHSEPTVTLSQKKRKEKEADEKKTKKRGRGKGRPT